MTTSAPFPLGPQARVAVAVQARPAYPRRPPFDPPARYPELPAPAALDPENETYAAVRELLAGLGLDEARRGTAAWSPLAGAVRPGDLVVVKPNLVKEAHETRPDDWDYVVTHPAVVRPILDYVLRALDGRGRVVIADGPQTDSSFARLAERTGYAALVASYRGGPVPVELLDLRQEEWEARDGVVVARRPLPGDPAGYTHVRLGARSALAGHAGAGRYYGASVDTADTNRAHAGGRHDYRISATVMAADVLIHVPKLKTHKKAGITACLKNLVGVNGHKNWLPHHTVGSPETGGDAYPGRTARTRLEGALLAAWRRALAVAPPPLARALGHAKRLGRLAFGPTEEVVRSGNWWGNDTVWRMILDLNRAVLHLDADGRDRPAPRRVLAVVDGVRAGEGNGPLAPDPVAAGVLVGGLNALAVDLACARLMGLDWRRIPSIARAFDPHALALGDFAPGDVEAASADPRFCGPVLGWRAEEMLRFAPHRGWKGHIELARGPALPA